MRWLLAIFLISSLTARPFYELPPVSYSESELSPALRETIRRLRALPAPPTTGKQAELAYLQSVLDELQISADSQVLVFSKTSLQNSLISPQTPRALYFSPKAYLGWIPGGVIELTLIDARLGPVFFTLEPAESGKSKVLRAESCLQCHATSRTEGVPGVLVRSVAPDADGHLILRAGSSHSDDRSPLSERWGGWYVTGHSPLPHLGNRTLEDSGEAIIRFEAQPQKALEKLDSHFDTSTYLRPTSDIVALLVLEHQCRLQNLLTKALLDYRRLLWFQQSLHAELDPGDPDGLIYRRTRQNAEEIVRALLFCEEASLGGAGTHGHPAFPENFFRQLPRTSTGAHLGELQLRAHIFKNRCSYMVYSPAFQNLPALSRTLILQRLAEILHAPEPPENYRHLKKRERERLAHILRETLPDFPDLTSQNGSSEDSDTTLPPRP
ncbi:MAG: hypothetical protein ACQKBY_03205 [Verrucomicrobiales bacterium]